MSTSRDYVAGAVLTAAQADDWAQGILGTGSITANSASTSGTTTLDIVTASAVTIAATNRQIKLSFRWWGFQGDTLGDNFELRLQEGGTVLNRLALRTDEASVGCEGGTFVHLVSSPSAASHTYKVTLTRLDGTGTALILASATAPGQLLVEDVGTA